MKRLVILVGIIFLAPVFSYAYEDWSDYSAADRVWDGQKSITNVEFEKAIDTLQAKQKKREAKAKKRKIRKLSGGGTSLHSGLDPMSEISQQDPLKKSDDDGQLLNIPVDLYLDGNILEKGYYNVYGEKEDNGDIYLSFYQSQFLKGKIKASETQEDFDADLINFVKLIPYNEDFVKIAFGSLKFNAFVYIRCANN